MTLEAKIANRHKQVFYGETVDWIYSPVLSVTERATQRSYDFVNGTVFYYNNRTPHFIFIFSSVVIR